MSVHIIPVPQGTRYLSELAHQANLPPEEVPATNTQVAFCTICPVPDDPHIRVGLLVWGNLLIPVRAQWHFYHKMWQPVIGGLTIQEYTEPSPEVVVRLLSTVAEVRATPTYEGRNRVMKTRRDPFGYWGSRKEEDWDDVPYNYLRFDISHPDANGGMPVEFTLPFAFPGEGASVTAVIDEATAQVSCTSNFYGQSYSWTESLVTRQNSHPYHYPDNNPLQRLRSHIKGGTRGPRPLDWWRIFLQFDEGLRKTDDDNKLAAVLKHKTLAPVIEELRTLAPVEYAFFRWLKHGKTWDRQCNNSLLAVFLKETAPKGAAALRDALRAVMLTPEEINCDHHWQQPMVWAKARRAFCLMLPGASDKAQEQEAKQDWTKRRGLGSQADGLGVTADNYPLLREAIEAGNIPMSIFHQPDKQPVNREFTIWEEALGQPDWAAVIYEIAKDAGRRSTYEKDITPYLALCLYKLPDYLDRHVPATKGTPKEQIHWKCQLKYVESTAAEVETNENGTVTTRSAFTPIVDNETRVVTVPYVAVVVGGVRTQWCYAQHYHLFERGFTDPISGGLVTRDFEPRLNGRDDYGLMFYTLIGTVTATGYPTFLIIFERLACGTRVHFHRVRPQRSKNGLKTPACELVEACYQYMAGNIPASEITAQQGDMVYIRYGALDAASPLDQKAKVGEPRDSPTLGFESHRHLSVTGANIELYPNQAKTPANRLGFMRVPYGGMSVRHPEHEDIEHLDEGWYEIRRAKSWEASPVGIWSLTID